MIEGGVEDSALCFSPAFHHQLSERLFPHCLRLTSHGIKVPIGNLPFEIGARFCDAYEGDADLQAHNLIAPGVEGGEGAHAFSLGRGRPLLELLPLPGAGSGERPVELSGEVQGVGRGIPPAGETPGAFDAIGSNDAHRAIQRLLAPRSFTPPWTNHGTHIDQYVSLLRGRKSVAMHPGQAGSCQFSADIVPRQRHTVVTGRSRFLRLGRAEVGGSQFAYNRGGEKVAVLAGAARTADMRMAESDNFLG